MPCTDPGTRSPGKLVLYYTLAPAGGEHSTGFNFITSVNINVVGPLQVEADRLAVLVRGCCTNKVTLTDWGIIQPGGHVFYRAPLTTGAGVGTHALGGVADYWYSQTIAFTGVGLAGAAGICNGRIIFRVHIQGALSFAPGEKTFNGATDAGINAFINGVNASTYLPADFFGQQGDINKICPVQWNAHTQRKEGA